MRGDQGHPLDGAHLFLGRIENIRVDKALADVDVERIPLERLDPVIYAPYRYYRTAERLGEMGEWKTHLRP